MATTTEDQASSQKTETMKADDNYNEYIRARDLGHITYMRRAQKCENFYLGGGRQWDPADRAKLEGKQKPIAEVNEILPTVNAILGYQINNRMDAQLLPARGKADQEDAKRITKVLKHILRENQYEWKESEVFADGLIQQRGYFNIRMCFDDNLAGEVDIDVEDPLDVLPDPYAKSYDPKKWREVTLTRWLTFDEIEDLWGLAARDKAGTLGDYQQGDDEGVLRNNFANNGAVETTVGYDEAGNRSISSFQFTGYESTDLDRFDKQLKRVRVIDRQFKRRVMTQFFVDAVTGDMRPVPDKFTNEQRDAVIAKMQGKVFLHRKPVDRIRWRVSAGSFILHDEWSPYSGFTIVPYFAYFRRGKTIGVVDNLISPQEIQNKMSAQALHIANSAANSGWVVEEDSLVDMDVDDLEDEGAKTGIVIVYARGSTKPEKIKPNPIPPAVEKLIERSHLAIAVISSIDATFKGMQGNSTSGFQDQVRQMQSSLSVGGPLDNLARTRYMVVQRVVELIQEYYTDARSFLITGKDETTGEPTLEQTDINQPQDDGTIMHDMTVGEYGVVINTVPASATYESSILNVLIEGKRAGMAIPDDEIIQRMNIPNRYDLADRIRKQSQKSAQQIETEQQLAVRQLRELDAQIRETLARAEKLTAEAARARATVVTGSVENAARLAAAPGLSQGAENVRQVIQRGG